MKTNYPALLNALSEMQESPAYAVRKGLLRIAEETILALEAKVSAARLAGYEQARLESKQRIEDAEAERDRYKLDAENMRDEISKAIDAAMNSLKEQGK